MADSGDFESWEKLLNKYVNEKNAQEKKKIIAGISKDLILDRFSIPRSPSLNFFLLFFQRT